MKLTSSVIVLSCLAGTCHLACGGTDSKSDPTNNGAAGATAGTNAGGTAAGGKANATSGASQGGSTNAAGNAAGGSGNPTAGNTSTAGTGGSGNVAGAGGAGGQPTGGAGGTSSTSQPGPTLTDPRDGATYDTVVINGQTWMAENLNFATATGSWCQNEDPAQCATSGRYYDWSVALGLPIACDAMQCMDQIQAKQQGVCPVGWHVTTTAEWSALFMKSDSCAMAKSTTGWTTGAGNNGYGFDVVPTGYRTSLGFMHLTDEALFWTTSDELPNFAGTFVVGTTGCSSAQSGKNFGLSVRCIQN